MSDDIEALAENGAPEDETIEAKAKLLTKRQKIKAAEDEAGGFWRAVFADKVGRREMWDLLTNCHTFEERFACGPNGFPQDQATWHQSGERDVGLRLWRSWLRLAPDGVMQMMTEHDPALQDAPKTRSPAKNVQALG